VVFGREYETEATLLEEWKRGVYIGCHSPRKCVVDRNFRMWWAGVMEEMGWDDGTCRYGLFLCN